MPYQGTGGSRGGFRREGGFGGGDRPRFGGPKRSFGGGFGGGNRAGGAPAGMHPAVCSDCGDECEVPFRPTGERPIFCGKCFGAKKGDFDGSRAPSRDYDRPSFTPRAAAPAAADNGAMTRELQNVNSKLDQLIRAVETLASTLTPKKESKKALEVVESVMTEEKPAKKAAKKKKTA
jgi:CxxC-x17-CxxC domain-containing protein